MKKIEKIKKIGEKRALLSLISNLVLQFCSIISGFIIPRLVLSHFGSEVNGLVSSLTQFLGYITILEGGISGVISARLYKPLQKGDDKKVSSIVKTATSFFRKIGWIYIIYALGLAILYPLLSNTGFSFVYVFSLTMILTFTLLLQYMFSLSMQILLKADRRTYIVSFVQIVITILNVILAIIVVNVYPEIHILKLVASALYIIQPVFYSIYIKKHYKISEDVEVDNDLIRNRWRGFAINLAAFIHNGTDITILTIFTNLQMVSVYAVHSLVTSGLKKIMNAVSSAMNPSIGRIYASGDLEKLDKKIGAYEFIMFFMTFFLYTLAALLITPFVMIYTEGINDADYNQPLFAVLLVIAEALYVIKYAHLNLSYAADKFKDITRPAIIEAVLNIVVSLVFVSWLGLVGVMIGTIVAMTYRMVFHVWYTKKIIPSRSQSSFYKKMLGFGAVAIIVSLFCIFVIPVVEYNVISWVWHAALYAIILFVALSILSLICFKGDLEVLRNYFKK